MKLYEKLRTNTEAVQQKMVEAKKNECANVLKEVKLLCKEFGFTAGMLKAHSLKEEKLKRSNSLEFKINTQVLHKAAV